MTSNPSYSRLYISRLVKGSRRKAKKKHVFEREVSFARQYLYKYDELL